MAAKTSTKTTTTKRSSRRPPAATSTATSSTIETQGPTKEEIQKRAFELYMARGREHGHAQEDWLSAERELRQRYSVS